MATDTEPGKDSHTTLWQALCWLAYNDFDAYDPPGDGSVRQEIKLALDTSAHKASLLEAVRDGKVSFEGRLGVHCDPPPSPGDAWREYHRTGHSADYSPIEPKDWPGTYNDLVIGWNSSTLSTPRGEFIDVRTSRVIMCVWHPGPATQGVERQIQLTDQQRRVKRRRDTEADAKSKGRYEMVLARARNLWANEKNRPGINAMAGELSSTRHADLGFQYSTVKKILTGTYPASKRLGIPGL